MKSNFITINELQVKINSGLRLFVFGVSEKNKVFLDSMRYNELKVSFLVDNDKSRQGTRLDGIEILAPERLLDFDDAIVVIANAYFAEVYEQLEKMEITEVYELTDINAFSSLEMIESDNLVKEECLGEVTDKVFVYVADGFGDNIIKYPLLERLSKSKEADNYYFMTDRQANYDIYSSLFKNVEQYNIHLMQADTNYRKSVMRRVNERHFKKKICFCSTAYFCTHFDPFGAANTNIPSHEHFYECLDWENGRTQNNAPVDMQRMAEKIFGWDDLDLSKKGAFSATLKNIELPFSCDWKYVTFGMGGISWEHVYKAERIAEVANWFLRNDYKVILLGQGAEDEKYNRLLCHICGNDKNMMDMTSQCSAFQSLKIIEGAELFIGLDSALAHGVYAMDKKGIVLMSGNNFSRRFMHENDAKLKYLTMNLDCLGCYQCIYGKWNDQMDKRGQCFSSIPPQMIISIAKELLSI